MVRVAILCVALLIPATAWSLSEAPPSAEVLTLEHAVALALRHNRMVRNAELEVGKSEDQLAAARTQRLPALEFKLLEDYLVTPLEFEFKKGSLGTDSLAGAIPDRDAKITTPRKLNTYLSASVTQPLSQLYRIGLGIQALEVNKEIVNERLRSQRQSVVNEVKRAYYAALQLQSGLAASQEAIGHLREVGRVVAEHVRQGAALRSEELEVRARLARTEHEALTLRNALASQKDQLNGLLGRDILTPFSVEPVPEATPVEGDLESARGRALERRTELREARLRVKQSEYDLRAKTSEYIPDVSLTFSYLSPRNVELLPKDIAYVGLILSWDVFDWGRKKRELAEKGKTFEQAQNGVRETETQIQIDVSNRFHKLNEARALLGVTELAREAAREALRVATDKYTQQKALLKDVLQAQTSLAEANHQYRQALLSFWASKADFEKAMGEE